MLRGIWWLVFKSASVTQLGDNNKRDNGQNLWERMMGQETEDYWSLKKGLAMTKVSQVLPIPTLSQHSAKPFSSTHVSLLHVHYSPIGLCLLPIRSLYLILIHLYELPSCILSTCLIHLNMLSFTFSSIPSSTPIAFSPRPNLSNMFFLPFSFFNNFNVSKYHYMLTCCGM